MSNWDMAILKSIRSRGGSAENREIYEDLEDGKFFSLSDKHLKPTRYGGRPAYQHQVRSRLSNLVVSGDVTQVCSGTHSITDKGKNRIGRITLH